MNNYLEEGMQISPEIGSNQTNIFRLCPFFEMKNNNDLIVLSIFEALLYLI
jgi:hypothetical protein